MDDRPTTKPMATWSAPSKCSDLTWTDGRHTHTPIVNARLVYLALAERIAAASPPPAQPRP